MTDDELGRLAAEIEAETTRAQRERRLDFWRPYPKQLRCCRQALPREGDVCRNAARKGRMRGGRARI